MKRVRYGKSQAGHSRIHSLVLFIDLGILPPEIDLSSYRDSLTLIGVAIFVFELIAEGDRA